MIQVWVSGTDGEGEGEGCGVALGFGITVKATSRVVAVLPFASVTEA